LQNTLSLCHQHTLTSSHHPGVLADVHWLSMRYWIQYKITLITFKALMTQQPQYLSELFHHYEAFNVQLIPQSSKNRLAAPPSAAALPAVTWRQYSRPKIFYF